MKSTLLALLTILSISTVGTPKAGAATVCGQLRIENICRTSPGCPRIFIQDGEENYSVLGTRTSIQAELEQHAQAHHFECVSGRIGADGDSSVISANAVFEQSGSDSIENTEKGDSAHCPAAHVPCL